MGNDKELALKRLNEIFENKITRVDVPWENDELSKTYRILLDNGITYFLKGTPRKRKEGLLMEHLHHLVPNLIPKIIINDILPKSNWFWFISEYAGVCSYKGLGLDHAIKAAFTLANCKRNVLVMRCYQSFFQNAKPIICIKQY